MGKYDEHEILIMHYDKNRNKYLDKTSAVQWFAEDPQSLRVKFYGSNTFYRISYKFMEIYRNPNEYVMDNNEVYINGHRLINYYKVLQFGRWIKVFYNNGFTRVVSKEQITDFKALVSRGPNDVLRFNYYMELAKESAIYENDFLASMYDKLDYGDTDSVLSKFLSRKHQSYPNSNKNCIYPFGLNLSQKQAVEHAFSNDISIIEGPPGTGKTQTILNIIANAVLRDKSVAVVSNNNAAIENVRDKMKEFHLDFLLALLGNKDNKTVFFDETINKHKPLTDLCPDKTFSREKMSDRILHLQRELPKLYEYENRLSLLKDKQDKYEKEYQYFIRDNHPMSNTEDILKAKRIKHASQALFLKAQLEHKDSLGLLQRIGLRLKFKVHVKDLDDETLRRALLFLDDLYYQLKIGEISREITWIENYLYKGDFATSKKELETKSMEYFKSKLHHKYDAMETMEYTYDNYRSVFNRFIKEYPVVLSTSYALIPSADQGFLFDYLIIDEASQTDLLSSVLAMSCAKNMIVVGDTKQLPQIDNKYLENVNEELKRHYLIDPEYDYFNNNILTSCINVFPSAPRVLLREHYRCHPDIINFCNEKFYNNELIILTEKKHDTPPMMVYKTVPGNHARKNPFGSGQYNQREIDEIKTMMKELKGQSVGVITPYRYQADLLQEEMLGLGERFEAETVHKFQGRAKDVIILSTVANDIKPANSEDGDRENFIARNDLLNVAVSRAKKQLRLVVSDKVFHSSNNAIADLIKYIRYNYPDSSIQYGKVTSVFDVLYADYQHEYMKVRKHHRKRDFTSEQLIKTMIDKLLDEHHNHSLKAFMHYPLRLLVTDTSGLNERERKYVKHIWSHVDFAIINTLTKEPVLVIEVDGVSFHEQDRKQSERDQIKDKALRLNNIPLLRLKTNESNEEQRIREALTPTSSMVFLDVE